MLTEEPIVGTAPQEPASPQARLRPVVASASIYAGTSALTVLAPVVLLPVLTRYLTPEDYGVVAMFQVLLGLYAAIVGVNVQGAISREYFNRALPDYPAFISSCLLIFAVSGVVAFAVSLLFKSAIVGLAAVPASVVLLAPLVAFAQGITLIRLNLWQAQARPIPFGAMQITLSLLQVLLTVWLVVELNQGWGGRVVALATASLLCMALSIVSLRRDGYLPGRIRTEHVKRALAFGAPLVPHVTASWTIAMADRMLVTNMVGLEATGVYAVGVQLGMAIGLLEDACNKAWVPWFFEQLESDRIGTDSRIIKIAVVYALFLFSAVFLLTAATSRLLPLIAGPQYQDAAPYVFWIAAGYAFSGIYKVAVNYLFFYRRTGIIAAVTVTTAALNIAMTIWLIKRNGALGAAQGACAAFFSAMLLMTLAAVRERRRALSEGRLRAQFA